MSASGRSSLDFNSLRRDFRRVLAVDIGTTDITTRRVVTREKKGTGQIRAKEALVVAGIPVAKEIFKIVDSRLRYQALVQEGTRVRRGTTVARVQGPAASILTGERTALNYLQHLSGIATYTDRCVRRVAGRCQVRDTRKTTPGLRILEKYAVRVGGGENHRQGLHDRILIKHNHWRLVGGPGKAVGLARGQRNRGRKRFVQVEVSSLSALDEALEAGADAVLLDNLPISTLRRALQRARGRAFVEISGGICYENLARYAALRPDAISLGALTHRARWVDLSLTLSGSR